MEVSSVFRPADREVARAFTGVAGTYTYVWVGHLSELKNPLLVVKAFLKFAERVPDACLYMIFQSDTLLPEIKACLALYPCAAEQIRLIGRVPHAELQQWFNSVDFLIATSREEVGGVSVVEGMSCGCIPVLSNIPSFYSMIGKECGLIYEEGNEQALLEALQLTTVLDIPRERARTLTRFENYLSFSAIANRIRDVLRAL